MMKFRTFALLIFVAFFPIHAKKAAHKKEMIVDTCGINTLIEAHENFGKTHFIMGFVPEQETKKPAESVSVENDTFNFVCDDGCVKHVFFMPDDHIQTKLLHLIRQEKQSIKITAYAFTNGDVAQELVNAAARKIAIEMVIDPSTVQDSYNKVDLVHEAQIPIFVYNPNYRRNDKKEKKRTGRYAGSLMHNKFIIFGKNIADKQLVWTGSSNLTNAALRPKDEVGNQENVIVTDEQRFIKKYEAQFEKLKQRAKPYGDIKPAAELFTRR